MGTKKILITVTDEKLAWMEREIRAGRHKTKSGIIDFALLFWINECEKLKGLKKLGTGQ